MDFARKILQNYGWKEGDGLGKNKDGIAKPLKASLKFDNAGFGANQATDDFNNHWWERVFNEATTNVNVSREGEKVNVSLKDEDSSVEISTKGYSVKKLKKLKKSSGEKIAKNSYENFLRASTLTNLCGEVDNADKIDTHDIEVSKVNILTDDELFKACGGRTAHKGARHGLKLSGKLARIEQQEAELLAKMMAKSNGFVDNKLSRTDLAKIPGESDRNDGEGTEKHKLKKKKRKHSGKEAETNSGLAVAKSIEKIEIVQQSCEDRTRINNPILGNHKEETFSEKSKKKKISSCLEENTSRKKKKKNKEKCLE